MRNTEAPRKRGLGRKDDADDSVFLSEFIRTQAACCPRHMEDLSRQFIEFALHTGVLKFGDFKMKSGRRSPYFFNSGLFSRGSTLGRLSRFYAQAALAARATGRVDFDMLFGPAYKGITLAAGTAMALAEYGLDVPFAFNRKEAKDHGEGGLIVGEPLAGRVLIVDDVITDGAAKRESVELIRATAPRRAAC